MSEARPGTIRLVSFDVFDTLLLRTVSASAAVRMETARLIQLLAEVGTSLDYVRMFGLRNAWQQRRAGAALRSGEGEWSLDHFARELSAELHFDEAHLQSLVWEAWFWTETRVCRPVQDIHLQLPVRARHLPKIVISDTWATEEHLTRLLASYGITVAQVYTSSSRKASKRLGDIYPAVAREQKLQPSQILHVGDNLEPDVIRARLAGMTTTWLPRRSTLPIVHRYTQSSAADLVRLFSSVAEPDPSSVSSLGRTVLAPVLLLLMAATHRRMQTNGSDSLAFIARDGWLMHKTAQWLVETGHLNHAGAYLRLSRRIISLAHPADYLGTGQGFTQRQERVSIGRVLKPFSLPSELVERIYNTSGLMSETPTTPRNVNRLVAALGTFRADIEQERERQSALIRGYIAQQLPSGSRLMLVDAGWAGSTQATIAHVCPSLERVDGTYLGVSAAAGARPDGSRWGLLRDDADPNAPYTILDRVAIGLRVWELVLRSGDRTAERLVWDEGRQLYVALPGPERPNERMCAQLAAEFESSLLAGLDALQSTASLLFSHTRVFSLADIRIAAVTLSRRWMRAPGPDLARRLLDVGIDESGNNRESERLLRDPREVWWPGVLATMVRTS
jgi:FMN phosphatase YigB (HAD superfamily)